ncbi:MAG TPA: preprotein translocase subunit SecG [Pyrinomonadaceae bacterium]|nr:preprotein translocase subunit SecG [Pyrinomonadaceae bacterium]
MLTVILYTLFILACIVLIVSVLLQPGKADAGALFTSSVSSTAFGPRGTQTILAKITIGAAAVFMLVALLLGMGVGGQRSLMEGAKAKPTPAATPAQQNAPAQTAASPAATTQDNGAAAPANGGNAPATQAASPESKPSPAK